MVTFDKAIFELVCEQDVVSTHAHPTQLAALAPLRGANAPRGRDGQKAGTATLVFVPKTIVYRILLRELPIKWRARGKHARAF